MLFFLLNNVLKPEVCDAKSMSEVPDDDSIKKLFRPHSIILHL